MALCDPVGHESVIPETAQHPPGFILLIFVIQSADHNFLL